MRTTYVLPIALAIARLASAQSFNCKLAKSPREHAVCTQSKLGALDSAVASAYKALRRRLSPESAARVQADQREWLQWLDVVCPEHGKGIAADMNSCLTLEYTSRESTLKDVSEIGDRIIFPRSHVLYETRSSNREPLADNDPGFGYGSLGWPQIDIPRPQPNAAYAHWNNAIKERTTKLAALTSPGDDSTDSDTAISTDGILDVFCIVEAANRLLIDTTIVVSRYGWGAAHPLTDKSSFLWWLDRNREATTSDIFLPQSHWQDGLALLAMKNLQTHPALKDVLRGDIREDMLDDDFGKTVKATVSDPTNWTLLRDDLTVTFGQYSIASYADGMPQAHIRWTDLKQYLAPDFQPVILPARIPRPRPR